MKKEIKQKCNHKWHRRRYCQKCKEIEMYGKITGGTIVDLENKLIVGDNSIKPNEIKKENCKHQWMISSIDLYCDSDGIHRCYVICSKCGEVKRKEIK